MLPNASPPTVGANSDRPWRVYILRESCQWVPVAAVSDRALGEIHVATLRRIMPRNRFQLVWEGKTKIE